MIEISVTGLQKSFDLEKKILDGLTFQINSGERVGLLGKNGAGKTTLFASSRARSTTTPARSPSRRTAASG